MTVSSGTLSASLANRLSVVAVGSLLVTDREVEVGRRDQDVCVHEEEHAAEETVRHLFRFLPEDGDERREEAELEVI